MPPSAPPPALSLRRRLKNAPALFAAAGWLLATYLRLCVATTRWNAAGHDDLHAALADGPVLVLLWHSRLMLGAPRWPGDMAQLSVLHDTSSIGRVAGAVQSQFGLDPVAMAPNAPNRAHSREVLRRLRAGHSIGLTVDGPQGPARAVKDPALEWARVAGRPVFVFAVAVARQRRLSTWDQMLLPLPFTRGASVYRRWNGALPRHADGATREAVRADLNRALCAAAAEVDAMVGLAPGP